MNSSASTTSFWEVRLADGKETKMTLMELDHAFEEGAIDTTTMVRELGKTEWEPLGRVAGLEDDGEEEDPPASSIEATKPPAPAAEESNPGRKIAILAALALAATMIGGLFVATLRFVPPKLFTKKTAPAAVVMPAAAPPQEAVFIGPPAPPATEEPATTAPPTPPKKKHTKGKVRHHTKH
jgi:hypothetical protein